MCAAHARSHTHTRARTHTHTHFVKGITTAEHAHTHARPCTHTRLSTNRRAQRQVRMSIPRQLVIKQGRACSTPIGAFLREAGAQRQLPIHPVLQRNNSTALPRWQHRLLQSASKPDGAVRPGPVCVMLRARVTSSVHTVLVMEFGLLLCYRRVSSPAHCPPRFVVSSDQQEKQQK